MSRGRKDLGSGHEGAIIRVRAGAQIPFDKPLCLFMVQSNWASRNYMESFFGITEKESDRSGLRQYDANSGIKDIGFSVRSGVRFRQNWRIGAEFRYMRLLGDAADSPIVDNKNQYQLGMGIVYSWGSKKLQKELTSEEEW